MNQLTLKQIKSQYPNQWVLIANPILDDSNSLGSIVNKLISGKVIMASKDRKEIGYHGKVVRKNYSNVACIYTGDIPKNRKWLL